MFRVGGWPVCQIRTTCRQDRFKGTATSETAWRGSHDCWCRILATLPEQERSFAELNSKFVAAMVLVLDRTTDIQNMCWEVVDNYFYFVLRQPWRHTSQQRLFLWQEYQAATSKLQMRGSTSMRKEVIFHDSNRKCNLSCLQVSATQDFGTA